MGNSKKRNKDEWKLGTVSPMTIKGIKLASEKLKCNKRDKKRKLLFIYKYIFKKKKEKYSDL